MTAKTSAHMTSHSWFLRYISAHTCAGGHIAHTIPGPDAAIIGSCNARGPPKENPDGASGGACMVLMASLVRQDNEVVDSMLKLHSCLQH